MQLSFCKALKRWFGCADVDATSIHAPFEDHVEKYETVDLEKAIERARQEESSAGGAGDLLRAADAGHQPARATSALYKAGGAQEAAPAQPS